MPFINVKLVEGVFNEEEKHKMAAALTEVKMTPPSVSCTTTISFAVLTQHSCSIVWSRCGP
jgi:hypothetical protein